MIALRSAANIIVQLRPDRVAPRVTIRQAQGNRETSKDSSNEVSGSIDTVP